MWPGLISIGTIGNSRCRCIYCLGISKPSVRNIVQVNESMYITSMLLPCCSYHPDGERYRFCTKRCPEPVVRHSADIVCSLQRTYISAAPLSAAWEATLGTFVSDATLTGRRGGALTRTTKMSLWQATQRACSYVPAFSWPLLSLNVRYAAPLKNAPPGQLTKTDPYQTPCCRSRLVQASLRCAIRGAVCLSVSLTSLLINRTEFLPDIQLLTSGRLAEPCTHSQGNLSASTPAKIRGLLATFTGQYRGHSTVPFVEKRDAIRVLYQRFLLPDLLPRGRL